MIFLIGRQRVLALTQTTQYGQQGGKRGCLQFSCHITDCRYGGASAADLQLRLFAPQGFHPRCVVTGMRLKYVVRHARHKHAKKKRKPKMQTIGTLTMPRRRREAADIYTKFFSVLLIPKTCDIYKLRGREGHSQNRSFSQKYPGAREGTIYDIV